jgi:hypothetical protein
MGVLMLVVLLVVLVVLLSVHLDALPPCCYVCHGHGGSSGAGATLSQGDQVKNGCREEAQPACTEEVSRPANDEMKDDRNRENGGTNE